MRYVQYVGVLLVVLFLTCPAAGEPEVVDSGREGFLIQVDATIQAPAARVYEHLIRHIGSWWESSHTYSGDARNLYLEAEPKGWFGERLPEGGMVQHMEVIALFPQKMLRLRGALGPLQEFALTGIMTWKLTETDEGTQLTLTYMVGGYRPGGLQGFEQPVDHVLATQVHRLKTFAESGE